MQMTAHQQNFMLSVRREMGWPAFKPVNDCIGWVTGREMDLEVGTEVGRIAHLASKDLIYTGWASTKAKEPTSFTIGFREMLAVDIIDHVVPFASDDQAPIILVSTRADEFFAIDRRGSLVRVDGKPKGIGKGRALAMKRIKAAAAAMAGTLMANNRFVPAGGPVGEPDVPAETFVRFS